MTAILKRDHKKPVRLPWLRWLGLLLILVFLVGGVWALRNSGPIFQRSLVTSIWERFSPREPGLAPLFTAEVSHWEPQILEWSAEYNLEPNLLATVMQIESCGHPTVNSYAGAQGLFQVMPFHFATGEDMLDPDTNARRGASFLNECMRWASGDVGLAMACYNGGPSVVGKNSLYWDQQVRDYYKWGTGIYADALTSKNRSETLDRWLQAGGSHLCQSAAGVQQSLN